MKDRFTRSRDGYSIEEVNRFVDEMTDAYEKILEKLKKQQEELASLRKLTGGSEASEVYKSLIESEKLKRKAHNIVISKLDE